MRTTKIYALYDTKDNDLCVFIGTVPEIAAFFDMWLAAAYHSIKQGRKFKKRYRAELIEATGGDSEFEAEKQAKNSEKYS